MDASLNDIMYIYSKVFLKDRLKNVVIKVLFTEIMSTTKHRREFYSSSIMFVM